MYPSHTDDLNEFLKPSSHRSRSIRINANLTKNNT